MCAINQTAVFLGAKRVIPAMIRAGGGSIVNVSSISGIVAIYGTPNVAYAASKFAVRGITKQIAIEYGKHGVPGEFGPSRIYTHADDDRRVRR